MQTARNLCRAGSANAASKTWQSGAVRLVNRIPPVWLVISGIISVQFGAAIAKDLFHLIPPTAMVWLRLITSAAILLIMVRPRLTGHSRRDWLVVLGFGLSLMTMNWAIYQSFARIPLGVAVTIEFLGPLAVAVVGSRRLTDLIWWCSRESESRSSASREQRSHSPELDSRYSRDLRGLVTSC